ncbi:MAG: hypothetical protein P8X74_05135 [Reinekea sp.]
MTASISNQAHSTVPTHIHQDPLDPKNKEGASISSKKQVTVANKSDAVVTPQAIANSHRKSASVTPNQKPNVHVKLANEILALSDIMKHQSPTQVKVIGTSDLVKDMVKLLSRGLTDDDPLNLSVFDKGAVVNLSELSDVARQVGLLVSEHEPSKTHNYSEKKSQDAQLIAELKSRGVDVERADEDHGLIDKNPNTAFVGKELGKASQSVANFDTMLYKMLTNSKTTIDQVGTHNADTHYQNIEKTASRLAEMLAGKSAGADEFAIETKLRMLLNYSPILDKALSNAAMNSFQAAFTSPSVSSIKTENALQAIDTLHEKLTDLLAAGTNTEQIKQELNQGVRDLIASGNVFGKISDRIKQNPANNVDLTDISEHTIAQWLASGKDIDFTQPVIMGTINRNENEHPVNSQPLLDNLVKALGVDTRSVPENTPVVIKMVGDKEQFEENIVEPFREKLIINTRVNVKKAGEADDKIRNIDLKQAPLVQTLENIISGDYNKVHPELLDLIDSANILEISSSDHPALAKEIQQKFNDSDNDVAQSLKRTMAARLLIPALCLEGTSISETAQNLAGPTLIGLGMDVGKNFIPDSLGALKTALVQSFFLGVDAADNLAGAWPEVQSLLETMGIKDVNFKSVFDEPEPATNADKTKEFLKLAIGLRSAEGEAGPAVATGLRSAVIGTIIGNVLSAGYSVGVGALDLNPALRAAVAVPAIVGTSLGIAINFAVNHADLSLAYKKQIDDGTLELPDNIDKNNANDLNQYCSDIAKRQLMLLSGTGPAAKAFTFAPLAGLSQLLGYVIPKSVVEAAITPLMPGMENIVRLIAMSSHNNSVENAMSAIDEKALSAGAQGQSATVSKSDLDSLLFNKTDHITADITLMVGGMLTGLLGRKGYQEMQIVPNVKLTENQLDQITSMSQLAAQNLQRKNA